MTERLIDEQEAKRQTFWSWWNVWIIKHDVFLL